MMSIMRVVIVGLGVQGRKRKLVAEADVVATVDPVFPDATYRELEEVPLDSFDAVLICTPDSPKIKLISYLLSHHKHILVEKPLFSQESSQLIEIQNLANTNKTTCYTAYNHRFEPHFIRMKELIESGKLGIIYSLRMFYGNGTARLVRNSEWRDQGSGVLTDLGSHLLDTCRFWFGDLKMDFTIHSSNCFENSSPDHVVFGARSVPDIQLEVSLVSWRNHFYADIYAEKGSAHIKSLCKWGPSTFTLRERQLPSGRPNENTVTLIQNDPTWVLEYKYFKELCMNRKNNVENDIWINKVLKNLYKNK